MTKCPYCAEEINEQMVSCPHCDKMLREAEEVYDEQESKENPNLGVQNPDFLQLVQERVQQILTKGEEILYIAVQNKPLVNLSPDSVVLTNRRFIVYRPKLLGRVSFEDYIWRDLSDARLTEDFVGATISMRTVKGSLLSVNLLPKVQARRIYAIAQEKEEQVLNERRMREMEESRARAGGVIIQGNTGNTPQGALPNVDAAQKLQQLKNLLESGLITQEEFDSKRSEIISSL